MTKKDGNLVGGMLLVLTVVRRHAVLLALICILVTVTNFHDLYFIKTKTETRCAADPRVQLVWVQQ